MSAETEQNLIEWRDPDNWPEDDVHQHFGEFEPWGWCEISWEGERLWKLMTNDNQEFAERAEAIISGVAAASAHGAIKQVAAMLGVDARELEMTVAEWGEYQDDLPPPIAPEQLRAKIAEVMGSFIAAREDYCKTPPSPPLSSGTRSPSES